MTVEQLPDQAPAFTLDHILGHSVSLSDYAGRTVVVVFGGRDSADQVEQSMTSIRQKVHPDQLPALGVSDLTAVPRPARILAKKQLKKAFEEAVEHESGILKANGQEVPEDPGQMVVMLLDWDGEVVGGFGLSGVNEEAVVVAVDGDGKVLGSATGAGAGEEILSVLPAD